MGVARELNRPRLEFLYSIYSVNDAMTLWDFFSSFFLHRKSMEDGKNGPSILSCSKFIFIIIINYYFINLYSQSCTYRSFRSLNYFFMIEKVPRHLDSITYLWVWFSFEGSSWGYSNWMLLIDTVFIIILKLTHKRDFQVLMMIMKERWKSLLKW